VLVLLVLAALTARSSLVRMYRMGGGSAAPTLLMGDAIWINLAAYDLRFPFTGWRLADLGDPRPGDVVLLELAGQKHQLIKRVLAVGGDTVELRGDHLVVNGFAASYQALDPNSLVGGIEGNRALDNYAIEDLGGHQHMIMYPVSGSSFSDFGPAVVPVGHFFLIGDNRCSSWDSRSPDFGFVPRARILGRMIGGGRPIPAEP
jgi:signal peptidase I